MPEISRFFGIVISIYHDDHNPPHFHARYAGNEIKVNMYSFAVIRGELPPRILGMVIEWAALHRDELLKNWAFAQRGKPLKEIQPLG